MTFELRVFTLNYLKENYPTLKPIIDEVTEKSDVKKLRNVSI